MKPYSFRSLLICFAIVIGMVVWIVFSTFSSLNRQKKEQQRIMQAREVLKISGPSVSNMQQLESLRANYLGTRNEKLLDEFRAAQGRLENDSINFARLAEAGNENAMACRQLAKLIHKMIAYSNESLTDSSITSGESGISIVDRFRTTAALLEDRSREVLNTSYSRSSTLTRETVTSVSIIVIVLGLVLIISFSFVYLDIKRRGTKEHELRKFNQRLEKQVSEKTAAIRDNEQRLQLIYNAVNDIIFLVSVEGNGNFRFTSVNEAFYKATGLKKEQVIGKHIHEVIPPESLPLALEKYKQAIEHCEPVEWEEVSEYPSGTKTGIVTITPIVNDKGECNMLTGVVHDITQRKKHEQQLVEAESKFRTLVEQSLIGVYIIKNGKFVYINPRFAETFGYKQDELMNSDAIDVIAPADKQRVAENIRARAEGEKQTIHYEATGLTKSGEEVELEIFCGGTLYSDSSTIIGTLLDITERKDAEKEIIEANERFNLIAQATNDAVWDWDIVNDKNWGNEVFYEYYGTKPGEPSNYETFLSRVHPDDRQRIVEKAQKAVQSNEEIVVDEFRFRIADGTYRYFFDRAYIMYDQDKRPVRMLGSMMDITEKHTLEEEIMEQKVQAQKTITRAVLKAEEEERNKIGQELHDNVNQILASTKLFLTMMKEGDSKRLAELVSHATSLVDNAINEIRILSHTHVTPLKEINLEELVQLLIYKVKETTTIQTDFQYNLDGQMVDDDLKLNIYRIIQEQLTNILKHSGASHVVIDIKADSDFLRVSIVDNGKGYDTSRQRLGVGISNMINRVDSFNGELTIDSSPGKGFAVHIKIPC
jgi:two-component system, NarL family, sensor histidine kinase UhpB